MKRPSLLLVVAPSACAHGIDASIALSVYTSTGEDLSVVDSTVELVEGLPQLLVQARASGSKAGERLTPGDVLELQFTCDRQAVRFPERFEHHLYDLVAPHASGRDAEPAEVTR